MQMVSAHWATFFYKGTSATDARLRQVMSTLASKAEVRQLLCEMVAAASSAAVHAALTTTFTEIRCGRLTVPKPSPSEVASPRPSPSLSWSPHRAQALACRCRLTAPKPTPAAVASLRPSTRLSRSPSCTNAHAHVQSPLCEPTPPSCACPMFVPLCDHVEEDGVGVLASHCAHAISRAHAISPLFAPTPSSWEVVRSPLERAHAISL